MANCNMVTRTIDIFETNENNVIGTVYNFSEEGTMSRIIKNALRISGALVMVAFLVFPNTTHARGPVDSTRAISGADSTIVNGWYMNDSLEATDRGEMSLELTAGAFSSIFSGIPLDSMFTADTVIIGSCYALSSLDSLNVPSDTFMNTAYDTIYFRYWVQNQGNNTDSLTFRVTLRDISDGYYFTPVDFDVIRGGDSTAAVHAYIQEKVDTLILSDVFAQEALDTFWVRIVLPGPLNATDGDSMWVNFRVQDNKGTGTYDAWPGTTSAGYHTHHRTVLDTAGSLLYHTKNDTVLDYGDDQDIWNFLIINAPILRLAKSVQSSAGAGITASLPGDTLTYKIRYDNDGSAWTEDTVNIVDRLPRGLYYMGDETLTMDTSFPADSTRLGTHEIDVDYMLSTNTGVWKETKPTTPESLNWIQAVRFQIPPGIGIHDAAGGDSDDGLLANGDTISNDSGMMEFKVRIR